jgi:proteic killer suppression protein
MLTPDGLQYKLLMMIKSFRHKGLEHYYETGSKAGITAQHADKLARILDRLDAALSPEDMNLPGYRLHRLSGQEKDVWSVWVNGNWRVTFKFENRNAVVVDYRDYH